VYAWSRGLIMRGKFLFYNTSLPASMKEGNGADAFSRFLQHLQFTGFSKERQIAFPHKQAWLMRMKRETWEGPYL
jgi:hypothetical protein